MIKLHFPLYQADSHTINMLIAAMDMHVPSKARFNSVIHYWSDFPQICIEELGKWDDGRLKVRCSYNIAVQDLEEYERLYQRIRSVFKDQGYVWAVSKGTSPLLREDLLSISEKGFWYDEASDTYFYHEFDISRFSEELQKKFQIIRRHDKWYMMSDYGPTYSVGRDTEQAAKQALKDNPVAIAYAIYVAGDPLFMEGKGYMSQKEAFDLLGILPQPYIAKDEGIICDNVPLALKPCRGFPWHQNRQGSHPDDI